MKKLYIALSVCAVIFLLFLAQQSIMFFVWANPYTETSGFPYIAKTLKQIDRILLQTQVSMILENKKIRYIYKNPYGSGFLRNNSIPNDLDYSVGVYIGEYKYDGNNANEIASDMVESINAFYLYLCSNITSTKDMSMYSTVNPFDMLKSSSSSKMINIDDIENSIGNVLKNDYYIKTTKPPINDPSLTDAQITYVLRPYEILLQRSTQIRLYSDIVAYNDKMPHYLREISIMPEFFAKIKTSEQTIDIELVPEVHWGTRMQLSRRCFGSTVFNSLNSLNFLKTVSWLNDNQDYIYARKLSFIRHLNEIDNIIYLKNSPVKTLKRIMQTAEMIHPMLTDKEYNEISEFVRDNLSNPVIVKLNELANIYNNSVEIIKNKNVFIVAKENSKLDNMYKIAEQITTDLESNKNIDKNTINEIKKFNKYVNEIVSSKNIDPKELDQAKEKVNAKIYEQMNKNISKPEKFKEYANLFNKIYYDSGYHRVRIAWYGDNSLAIEKNDFTKNIKNLDIFVQQNNFPKDLVNKIKIMDISKLRKLPDIHMSYYTTIRYDEHNNDNGYGKLVNQFLADKINFNPKIKFVIIK